MFYVINASSARIELGEIDKIKEIKQKYDTDATIVFTHCDVANSDTLCELKKHVRKIVLKVLKFALYQEKQELAHKVKNMVKMRLSKFYLTHHMKR